MVSLVDDQKEAIATQMIDKINEFKSSWAAAGQELRGIAGGSVWENLNGFTTPLGASVAQLHQSNVAAWNQVLQQIEGQLDELKELASTLAPKQP